MIGVAVGTYGDRDVWKPLAMRALRSVLAQSQHCLYEWVHAEELHVARNEAARRLITKGCEWIVFLDADDELDPSYLLNMALAASANSMTKWPILQPSTIGIIDGVEDNFPFIAPPTNLITENFLIIGCMHKAEMFTSIGGFDDWAMLEDWAYWLKAWVHGAVPGIQVPDALYRVHIDTARVSRNQTVSAETTSETFTKIRAQYLLLARQRGLA